jgi:hypothetical protein
MRSLAVTLVLALTFAGCGGDKPKSASSGTTDTLTQRQRDSILSTSNIPGARGVGAAMRAADSTSAHIRATDTVSP